MLGASALVACGSLFAKMLGTDALGPPLNPIQITHGRFVVAFLAVSLVVAVVRPSVGPVHWGLHVARTTFGAAGITLMFAAVAFIPMADATALSFLNPVFAMMLAIPLLGERVGLIRWSAALIALVGGAILLRPGPSSFDPAALFALGSAVVIGIEVILVKRLSSKERPLPLLWVNNGIGVVMTTVVVLFVWQMPTATQAFALLAVGTTIAAAQALYVNAMARAEASYVVPFSYSTLVFATLLDMAVFGTRIDAVSAFGAAVILAGAGLLAWRDGRRKAQGFSR